MKLTKVLLKVLDEGKDKTEWIHFCYINEALYKTFLRRFQCERVNIADYLSKWVKEDFNIQLTMATRKDISILKELIKDRCKRVHQNLYLDSTLDSQGWTRVWLSGHMTRELKKYGK